ncbi:MAG TPA: non-hydrolyzing UDP-N-acetylglucosamine 2-epimerase [Candidatus Wunengus sp. YC65]|uniref:non-hydrolyzing UDP-N-acetylglucosamine 2-epimerase n=1 Tax=Candidatus Wunengus sp. YC65 TaxID=3367701 RepID=UPI004025EE8D
MHKIKVMTIVGTRPEIIRLSRVSACLDKYTDHILVHTGQNYDYELNEIFFKEMEVRKPDYFIEAAGATAAETIGQVIIKVDPILEKEKPEALLILGDTNSCLSAIPAKRRKIPIFHMEAGNRCFDQRVPEEINRKIIDHISDINLTYSSIAREYLLREGLPPELVIKTGSPLFEVLNYYSNKIDQSQILKQLTLTGRDYFVVSAHREENIDSEVNLSKLTTVLNGIAESYGKRIIVSTHPRTRKRVEAKGIKFHNNVELLKPLGFFDYVHLQKNAYVVLSDSGTITEESSILNFPALNIREAHERPEGMEEAAVMMTGLEIDRIYQGITVLQMQKRGEDRSLRMVGDYSTPNVSEKVVRLIISYTDYVNRTVWRK